MVDVLVCRAKTFSHVQIFVLDQNKRTATLPLCTMEARDCGTPQHLKCKSNLILQNKADILWIVSWATCVLAKGWHREISKCWGVLHMIGQVTGLLPLVYSLVQIDAQIHSASHAEARSPKTAVTRGGIFILQPEKIPEFAIYVFIPFPCCSRCLCYSPLTTLGCYCVL